MKINNVSVVIPTYNERENISILIPEIEGILKKNKLNSEIIIVDDSSPDGTADLVRELNKKYKNIKVIVKKKKEGIGAALRVGYDNAKNEIIVSTDSDLSFNPSDITRLLKKISEGNDLVVGSRHFSNSCYEKKNISTRVKAFVSKYGNVLVRTATGVNIRDFSANFRAIRNEVWRSIKTTEKTNSILLEMILKTKYKGYKVAEIPVVFKDRVYGKSKLILSKEAPKFLIRLIYYVLTLRLLKKD